MCVSLQSNDLVNIATKTVRMWYGAPVREDSIGRYIQLTSVIHHTYVHIRIQYVNTNIVQMYTYHRHMSHRHILQKATNKY